MAVELERFNGGMKWIAGAGAVGAVGLILNFIGMLGGNKKDAFYSYLFSFTFWTAVAIGGLLLLMIMHVTNAKWPTVIRRPMEAVAGALPAMAVLFIPILFGMGELFRWVNPAQNFTALEQHHFHGAKHIYLDTTFFYVRQVIYWVVFLGISTLIINWSKRLDEVGGHEWIARTRKWSAGGIPIVALAMTWASFDWLMTLTPFWQSTMFGVYYFAGGFLAAIAVVTLATVATAKDRNLFGFWATPHHHHNLGKLLLAFVSFWAYIGFSQLMLVWIANLPEEVPYYWVRLKTGWVGVSTFLIFGHFALPFVMLISRTVKLIPRFLGFMSVWLIIVSAVDSYWLVMPALYPEGPNLTLNNFTAFFGVGGIAIAFALWRVRGRYMVPVKDPYLEDSLRYVQP